MNPALRGVSKISVLVSAVFQCSKRRMSIDGVPLGCRSNDGDSKVDRRMHHLLCYCLIQKRAQEGIEAESSVR